ncbi:MAG: phosphatidylinositol mannoside acyltransferase [Actinocatenispora sp.]
MDRSRGTDAERAPSGWSERVTELGYAAGWKLVRMVPAGVARSAFRIGADHATRRGGRGPWQLGRNLRRVVGPVPDDELAALVRAGMRSYARYWMEAFRLPNMSAESVRGSFHMTTPELFDQARDGGVFALPHSANWELAGLWATSQGLPLTSVAERLKPESLYRRFVAYRESLGLEILPTRGGERPPMEVLAQRLEAGHLVALLADRDLSARGVPVRFFGHPTRMPAGPAALALQTGRPLFAVSLWYDAHGTYARLTGPLTTTLSGPLTDRVADLTQQIADALAVGIAEHPEDWHMLSRLWLDDQPRDDRDRAGGSAPPPALDDATSTG